jgi:esterase/lipase superfamily enzyme
MWFCYRLSIFAVALSCLAVAAEDSGAATDQDIVNRSLEGAAGSVRMKATRHRDIAYRTVFFATNRKLNLSSLLGAATPNAAPISSNDVFLDQPAVGIVYGQAEVMYPVNRKRGEATYNKDIKTQNPLRDFLVSYHDLFSSLTEFRKSVDEKYPASKATVLYVHGLDLSFDDAAERMAQMSLDIADIGVPIFFSWPSDPNRDSTTRYIQFPSWYSVATHNSNVSRPYAGVTILNIAAFGKPYRAIGHSMGADLLGNALVNSILYDQAGPKQMVAPHAVLLLAPDIADQDFSNQLAPILATTNLRLTVYCTEDRALLISRAYNYLSPRLGWCSDTGRSLPGIDVVFVSGAIADPLRHSYYLNSTKVLDDMGLTLGVIPNGLSAGSTRRINLQER